MYQAAMVCVALVLFAACAPPPPDPPPARADHPQRVAVVPGPRELSDPAATLRVVIPAPPARGRRSSDAPRGGRV